MEDLQIKRSLVIPGDFLELSVARSGGPGGQHVNKTNSKVVIRIDLGACGQFSEAQLARLRERIPARYLAQEGRILILTSSEERDQGRNRETCRLRLAAVIRDALARPKTRRPTKPTRGSNERRLKSKQEKSRRKADRRQSYD
ncbi:MAG: aminoacyl-tRNA hydrolase [Planctomycetes bacterium]|nr:aminoacyl-tRNA hydrolase [Planctomycetota bacterium]